MIIELIGRPGSGKTSLVHSLISAKESSTIKLKKASYSDMPTLARNLTKTKLGAKIAAGIYLGHAGFTLPPLRCRLREQHSLQNISEIDKRLRLIRKDLILFQALIKTTEEINLIEEGPGQRALSLALLGFDTETISRYLEWIPKPNAYLLLEPGSKRIITRLIDRDNSLDKYISQPWMNLISNKLTSLGHSPIHLNSSSLNSDLALFLLRKQKHSAQPDHL